ncbi:hypothetical protein LTR97_010036 [Elasticomyces elasticus]|uniref:Uncharacterized protein n=1 Tax=Elasticomyces elasticus TaxID=574655 RepID=A0AAN7ZWS9_9PEZI|nr:hypothetical protein LTR97_010036 [Elasticomyces elasticus]
MQETPAPPTHVLQWASLWNLQGCFKSIVSTHNGKGMYDIDSAEEQVSQEPRYSSNRRPKNQKMKRKEKIGIELVNMDVWREQLRTKYDADMDHMSSHDIDLTIPALATTNVVVLRRFVPLPADHDVSTICFEEKSVKESIYDTLDHGSRTRRYNGI